MTEPSPGEDLPAYDNALAGEQTELAPSSNETEAYTAWALDDGPEWRPPFWTEGRVTGTVVGLAVLAVVLATGVGAYHLRPVPTAALSPTPTVSPAITTATTTAERTAAAPAPPAPPPAETVTITRETVTERIAAPANLYPSVVDTSVFDQRLITNLQIQGWTIIKPQQLADRAHEVCAELRNGNTPAGTVAELQSYGEDFPNQADVFVTTVMATYPNCR